MKICPDDHVAYKNVDTVNEVILDVKVAIMNNKVITIVCNKTDSFGCHTGSLPEALNRIQSRERYNLFSR